MSINSGDQVSVARQRSRSPYRQSSSDWVPRNHSRSSASSASTIPSVSTSQPNDDLDLDSLFKRLDKYTAEMDEVEARLRQARSASEESSSINIKRFSFEVEDQFDGDKAVSTVWDSSRISSPIRTSLEEQPGHDNAALLETTLPVVHSSQSGDGNSCVESTPRSGSQGETETLVEPDEAKQPASPESKLSSHGPVSIYVSSYSEHMTMGMASAQESLVVKRQSATPPAEETPSTPGSNRSSTNTNDRTVDETSEEESRIDHQYDQTDFSESDELPQVTIPTSWKLPPRSSSRPLPLEDVLEKSPSSSPNPLRRRITTREERSAIRNGGFWSTPAVSLFDTEDTDPPVPALSQAGSTATLSPPATPLSICSPEEDQIRREMENSACHDGAKILESKHRKRRPPVLDLADSDDEPDASTTYHSRRGHSRLASAETGDQKGVTFPKPRLRRQRSILSIFHRKSPVEKLIDMYLDDSPEEKPLLRRLSTKSRKSSPTQANMPKSPRIPSLPNSSQGEQQVWLR